MDTGRGKNDHILTWTFVLVLSAIAVAYRMAPYYLLPPGTYLLWNLVPIGALALFAGSRLRQHWAYAVPLAIMLVSDLMLIRPLAALGMSPFSWGTVLIYASFAVYVLIGRLIREGELSPLVIGGAALLASAQFFLLTNFAVWYSSTFYPHTFAGLMECYLAGVPFYRNTLAGDLFFSGLIFGVHALAFRPARSLETAA
jgi:hypothetical protein